MRRRTVLLWLVLGLALLPGLSTAQTRFTPGAPGIGDGYFPLAGNGGYDVKHYLLDLTYTPSNDRLSGTATLTIRALQNLSQFNLDFEGLSIESITIDGKSVEWRRDGGELIVKPRQGLRNGTQFRLAVRYAGVPETLDDLFGTSGFIHTDDGAVVAGQPRVAATWFPVNDHPSEQADYTISLRVPKGLTAVSNGRLHSTRTSGDWTTWVWEHKGPMASYLVVLAIGDFDLRSYQADGIKYWDALDPDLFEPFATPRSGAQYALSQAENATYKRLTRTISVPAGGAELSFWANRNTEANWDYLFVEAHTVGQDDWTTLPDANGNTSQDTGQSCPSWLELHPLLAHYQTAGADACAPSGTTGEWWAASGASNGWEQWSLDLARWAGGDVEVSISYASDESVQLSGVAIDDIVVSTGAGTTSFEADGDTLDGWTVPGAPPTSPPNSNDWIAGTVADAPEPIGGNVEASLARQPEVIRFLTRYFGPYPWANSGGIVDDTDALSFALETQTRPIYSKGFFTDPLEGDAVVVHELAHQWAGDSLNLARWRHIWLNEGFATYAEWLWSEDQGLGTAQEIFDFFYTEIPADSPFWSVKIGDPTPELLFDFAVYARGAMTLHALRLEVGDETMTRILRSWGIGRAGANVATDQFISHAERISGRQLDDLFATWLFSTAKPVLEPAVPNTPPEQLGQRRVPPAAQRLLDQAKRSGNYR